MTKGHKIALKNTKDCIEITKKKLFNLKKEKLLEYYKVIAAARVFKIAALEKEILD